MAKRFTRNIKDTIKITDEPLHTNSQNDLISDDTDIAIRHKDEYHYLTDNIKKLSSGDTDRLTITSTGKNSRRITPSENLVLRSEMSDYVDSKIDEIPEAKRVWWISGGDGYSEFRFSSNIPTPDDSYVITVIDVASVTELNLSIDNKSTTSFTFSSDEFVSGRLYRITINASDDTELFRLVFTAV